MKWYSTNLPTVPGTGQNAIREKVERFDWPCFEAGQKKLRQNHYEVFWALCIHPTAPPSEPVSTVLRDYRAGATVQTN